MDYLGHSILEFKSSGPGDLAAILILQQEVADIEVEIDALRNESKAQKTQISTIRGRVDLTESDIKFLQNESKTLQDDIGRIDDQVAGP